MISANLIDNEVAEYIQVRLRGLGLTQRALAESAGIDETTLSKILARKTGASLDVLRRIADVFELALWQLLAAHRYLTPGKDQSARRYRWDPLPVYGYAELGDPTSTDNKPIPVKYQHPPPGKEMVIGEEGFGVQVEGDSMTQRKIHDGDVVWVNPELPARVDKTVVAFVNRCVALVNGAAKEGHSEEGVVVKVLIRQDDGRMALVGEGPSCHYTLDCQLLKIIGPIVGVSSWRVPL